MRYWLVVHSRESYNQHKAIGFPTRKGTDRPYHSPVQEISPNDKIIYYMKYPDTSIRGIFSVIEGPGKFYDDWKSQFQFKLEDDLVPQVSLPIQDLVPKLDFFEEVKDDPKRWSMRLATTISELSEDDYQTIRNELSALNEEIELEPEEEEGDPHIEMIVESHQLAEHFRFKSFIGRQERSRVIQDTSEATLEELPEWLSVIARNYGYVEKIDQIDNIWFQIEDGEFLVPTLVFEHERSKRDRAILDRFTGLLNTLAVNNRFKTIEPKFVIVVEEDNHKNYFQNKIQNDGSWQSIKENVVVFDIKDIKDRSDRLLSLITDARDNLRENYHSLS